jgi:hypothetical protein
MFYTYVNKTIYTNNIAYSIIKFNMSDSNNSRSSKTFFKILLTIDG